MRTGLSVDERSQPSKVSRGGREHTIAREADSILGSRRMRGRERCDEKEGAGVGGGVLIKSPYGLCPWSGRGAGAVCSGEKALGQCPRAPASRPRFDPEFATPPSFTFFPSSSISACIYTAVSFTTIKVRQPHELNISDQRRGACWQPSHPLYHPARDTSKQLAHSPFLLLSDSQQRQQGLQLSPVHFFLVADSSAPLRTRVASRSSAAPHRLGHRLC